MSSEKSVPGERAQEAELQVEMKKTQVGQITHFAEDNRELPSSERTLDATPIIANPQDLDKPQGPADTSSVTSTGQGIQRMPVSRFLCTKLPPGEIKIGLVGSDTASLSWGSPDNMDGIPHSFKITYSSSDRSHQDSITALSNSTVISKLRPGTEYSLTVNTVLENGTQSMPASASVCTKTHLEDLLCKLGLENYFPGKITLSTVLEIGTESITDKPIQSLKKLPWCFLKRLMMVNVTARSTKCSATETDTDLALQDLDSVLELIGSNDDQDSNTINPLDLITALFLCSDSFLQQEMMLKMSMCQFAVPLLLPDCSTIQCTLMLWAMRDIVKKFRPHSLADPKGFVEDSIVSTAMPMISFVRLGDCSLSKSQILNQVLSNPQQYHDVFIHRNMECGDVTQRIANGLVDISWYLPCGNKNLDIFPEPVAVANLHGDLLSFQKQFSILCQTSSAVFIFFDSIAESECNLLSSAGNIKAQLFLVANFSNKTEKNINSLKDLASKLKLSGSQILFKKQQTNDADFVSKLRLTMKDIMENCQHKMTIEGMSIEAHELGIPVDEDCTECQNAKRSAAEITGRIDDVVQYKEDQLPLQGKLWKELAKIEKEECRLRKAGDKPIEEYKANLQREKQKLRQQQSSYDLSEAMQCFITAISNESKQEQSYFLKWMRMNLDVTARKKLSGLRDEYKEKSCKLSVNKEIIAALDQQILNSSLGIEHFMREMGQIYEAACYHPDYKKYCKQFQYLPSFGAELLLDGFPLELVDGDASNIPVRWVTDVLTKLHEKVQHKSRVLVVTVLGVQSTGKSTLLNTMFGVQFAVSSGRCTRGAFMLLIRVKEDLKEELKCDFILVIDTEGLKSPALAQLEDSYEHDNELATLVVGLSDITIINIAMENSTEMKDILQIVVHAFLRMKEVGKKPNCHFVHQNVGDVSAYDKNMRDRNKLLEQLNEMTQAASRMEKKGPNKKFTDIMEYDAENNNWYIPGLWHGNPPMAPVNTGYSETVYQFKKSLIELLKSCTDQKPPAQITEFLEWVESLWKAVKYENFIFSFRNSLVAEAYSNLCVEFNTWEWDFRKHMYTWLANAETRISNLCSSNYDDFMCSLTAEASSELAKQENEIQEKLANYYKKKNRNVHLVEKHREDFVNSIKSLRREIENSVKNKCETDIAIHKEMKKINAIREEYRATIERKVLCLIDECKKRKSPLSEEQLENEFETMWKQTVSELTFQGLKTRDIVSDTLNKLRINLGRQGSHVQKELSEVKHFNDCGQTHFTATEKHFDILHNQKINKKPGLLSMCKNTFKNTWKMFSGKPEKKEPENKATEMANKIIQTCQQFVSQRTSGSADYHDTYTRELLQMIDKELENEETLKTNAQFELDLKLHICGYAAREFQKMHEDFNEKNDPKKALEKCRPQYCSNFKDLYHEKDQCRKTAEEFTERCLKPAVREYINKALGIDIVDEILTGAESVKYSSRSFFQFSLLKQILDEDKFEIYVEYIRNYEKFVKVWISNHIVQKFSKDAKIGDLQVKRLETITKKIQAAIENAQKETAESQTMASFIQMICRNLDEDLVICRDELGTVLFLKNSNNKEFAQYLQVLVNELTGTLRAEFSQGCDVEKKLINLPFKPQDELFKRMFGCGMQCPFCKVPCEAGGQDHKEHHASVHRPQGLGRWRYLTNEKLTESVCTSDVFSERKFRSCDTQGKFHPYKDYRDIYPDWNIPPDPSIEASDYWKYVMTKFNKEFAVEYHAKPADIPEEWRNKTKEMAMKSLSKSFNVKT
ncbi:interferon-induced very large GTPase 1-like isoform X2 [Acipenser ruthenus]|nr:interferon-induced very large GTPase 1-like isoform X2 [Acipenser ruthenus]